MAELHKLFSKKIAQLTKVVYHLNTKNEDHQMELKALQRSHGDEVSQILKDAKARIEDFKRQVDDGQSTRMKEALKALAAQHDAAKSQALAEFDAFKKLAAKRERELQDKYQKAVDGLVTDLRDLQVKYKTRAEAIDTLLAEADKKGDKALRELKAAHEKEVADLVKSSNQKYNDMLVERMGAEDALRKQLEDQIAKGLAKLKADEAKKLQTELEKAKTQQAAAVQAEKEAGERVRDKMRRDAEKKEEELRAALAAAQNSLAKQAADAQALEDRRAALEGKHGEGMMALKDRDAAIERLKTRVSELEAELKNERGRSAKIAKDMAEIEAKLTKTVQDHAASHSDAAKQAAARALQSEKSERELRDEISRLQKELEQLRRERSSLLSSQDASSQQHADLLAHADALKAQLAAEKKRLESEAEAALAAERAAASKLLAELRADLESKLEEARRNGSSTAQSVEAEAKRKVDEAVERAVSAEAKVAIGEAKIRELQAALAAAKDTATTQASALEELRKNLATLEAERESLSRGGDAARFEASKLRAELATATETLARVQRELAVASQSSDQAVTELKAKLAASEESARAILQQRLDELKSDLDAAWSAKLKEELAALTAQMNSEKQALLTAQARQHSAEIADLRGSAQGEAGALRSQLRTTQSQLADAERRLVGMQADLVRLRDDSAETAKRSASALQKEHEQALLAAQQAQEKALLELAARLEQEAAARLAAALAEAATRHAAELALHAGRHGEELEGLETRLREQHVKALNEERTAGTARLNALDVEWNVRLSEREKQLMHELNDAQDLVQDVTEKNVSLSARLNELQQAHRTAQDALAATTAELQTKVQEVLEIRRETTAELRRLEDFLRTQNQDALAAAKEEHRAAVETMAVEFGRAQALMAEKEEILRQQIAELELRYQNRESREEDLERIRKIEAALQERTYQLQKAIEDMKFYKLELVNREHNFTALFANPEAKGRLHTGGPSAAKLPALGKPRFR